MSLWLLLSGGIADRVLAAAARSPAAPVRLLLFYLIVTALTVVALWVQLENDEAPGRSFPPGRRRQPSD
ncbi:MAG: hypothetical protein ACJ79E_20070 [Anaeromyxobacteraceae bacterium]